MKHIKSARTDPAVGGSDLAFRDRLLAWYDRNRRRMPWRAEPGLKPDPYYVWLSEIMLQQTTVQAVIPYFLKFVKTWPSIAALASAGQSDVMDAWAGLGYYSRARNLHKCARKIVEEYDGLFPDNEQGLLKLPGIGPYTAAAIASIAFDRPANVVDGNVERVVSRLYNIRTPLPDSKPEIKERAGELAFNNAQRPGDYAQALMDLGATICTPRSPKCMLCPVQPFCVAFTKGDAAELPYKRKKNDRPVKSTTLYLIEDAKGQLILHRRQGRGMLAGTIGFPTTEWHLKSDAHEVEASYLQDLPLAVRDYNPVVKPGSEDMFYTHVFTHFALEVSIQPVKLGGCVATEMLEENNWFVEDAGSVAELGLPTVFKKAYRLVYN